MKPKKWSPMLAPNQVTNLDEIQYSLLASTKLDGCRMIFHKDRIVTRSLKNVQNKQINEKFETIRQYCEENNTTLDGELYAHGIPFQFIVSCFMTHDYYDKKSVKKWKELCEEHNFSMTREEVHSRLKFYCFDCIKNDDYDISFIERCMQVVPIVSCFKDLIVYVDQFKVGSKEEVNNYFEAVLEQGYEGLILRSFEGRYKMGRGTIREGIIYKVKPWVTIDAEIIDIVQATEVDPNAEKKTNELGRSVTSKKSEDRIPIEKASAFVVLYEGQEVKPVIAMTDKMKEYIWNHQDEYIGKIVEYKFLKVGMKEGGLPRHPTTCRMRKDKDK